MATKEQIAELRFEIKEPSNVEPYTDEFLGTLIDGHSLPIAARKIWVAKRNAVADLVDIGEAGSTRKMSQLFTNYDKIVKSYDEVSDPAAEAATSRAPRTRAATRV